jgi:endonuclease YncB( thermonuclease family)
MAKGILRFSGTIDLTQFWPQNIAGHNSADSDADTVKVKIDKATVLFTSPDGKQKKTSFIGKAGMFENQKQKSGTVKKFKPVIDSKGNITMRLQGIDAPELHYSVRIHGNPLYRQLMGETSTIQLYKFLRAQVRTNSIACEVSTQVNVPNDVFDKYGRCVGDIFIKNKRNETVNVNHWLAENGWAFPAYYDSMTTAEIREINALALKAMENKLNIWKFFSARMTAIDKTLTHDKNDASYSAQKDRQPPLIFPKLFRRLWTHEIQNQSVFSTQGFKQFLMQQKSDRCCKTSDFLDTDQFPKKAPLFGSFVDAAGKINFKPADLVFKEAGTTLKDSNGKPITSF